MIALHLVAAAWLAVQAKSPGNSISCPNPPCAEDGLWTDIQQIPVSATNNTPAPGPPPPDLPAQDPPAGPPRPPRLGALAPAPATGHRVAGPDEPAGERLGPDAQSAAGAGAEAGGPGARAAAPVAAPAAAPAAGPAAARVQALVGEISAVPGAKSPAQRQAAELLRQAQSRIAIGDLRGALVSAGQAVALEPGNAQGWVKRAEAYNQLRLYDEALPCARKAAALDPQGLAGLDEAAWALYKLGRYQEAVDAASRAIAADPRDAMAYAIRARARWALGDKAGALADAERAAALDARYRDLLEALRGGTEPPADSMTANDVSRAGRGGRAPVPWPLALGALVAAALGTLSAWRLALGKKTKLITFSALARPRRDRIGRKYELLRLIGRGGMGEVYEARDHSLGRSVAVKKVTLGSTGGGERARAMLKAEAATVASLHHPSIVDIYELVEEGKEIYLVFELVRGRTLAQALETEGPLSPEAVVAALTPVCQALQFAHAKHFVHRDLKPANIMVTEDGFVKLMDFGIARPLGDAPRALDQTQTIMGTPLYMAPEMESGQVGAACDVFALGVTAYQLLTGQLPYETLDQKRSHTIVPASRRRPTLPAAVDAVIAAALHPEPAKRLGSAREFLAALQAAAQPHLTPPAPVA